MRRQSVGAWTPPPPQQTHTWLALLTQVLLKSRLLRVGSHGGKQWNKEALSPAPHPGVEPVYLGCTRAGRPSQAVAVGEVGVTKLPLPWALRSGSPCLQAYDPGGEGARRPNLEEVRERAGGMGRRGARYPERYRERLRRWSAVWWPLPSKAQAFKLG